MVNKYLLLSSVNPSEVVFCPSRTRNHDDNYLTLESFSLGFGFIYFFREKHLVIFSLTCGSFSAFACKCHVCDAM